MCYNNVMKTAILASQNKNKIREIDAILSERGIRAISRDEAGIPTDDIEETGSTFEENSLIKAKAIREMIEGDEALSDYLESPVIADDSGLMVDALDGEPGVYSARYAGEGCTYDDNNSKLLDALKGVPDKDRTAHFVTVITMIYPDGQIITAKGECHGRIIKEKRGSEGFGYDPVFMPDGYDRTFAELGSDVKNRIGHRAQALIKLKDMLNGL